MVLNRNPRNTRECHAQHHPLTEYQLAYEREKQLADDFTFISATEDDMYKVMADAVEEDPDRCGMTIQLASNSGDLEIVENSFMKIAKILEKGSFRSE
ncbi:hypothetical protein N7486_008898 [Penicillium sp. IBT 16267x]|nr:hypothetical protein N7486_008898 [Penicillium sp. IBT 16267x]